MKICITLLFFLYGNLGAMMDDEKTQKMSYRVKKELNNNRLGSLSKVQTQSKQTQENWERRIQEELSTPNLERRKTNAKILQEKSEKEKNLHSGRSEHNNVMQNNKEYIQKMANQLFLAQKQVSLLSDYQKSILSQDPLVKRFVFGPTEEARKPKPFTQFGRKSLVIDQNKNRQISTTAPLLAKNFESKEVSGTQFSRKLSKINKKSNIDNFPQPAKVNYVTITPITTSGYVNVKVLSPKEDLIQTPKPYLFYDVSVSQKPELETISAPTTRVSKAPPKSMPRVSSRASRYIQDSIKSIDDLHQNYGNAKYEFKYSVKDPQKNNHFGHMETRSDETTFGYYFVHLPDGRLETVKYWADKTGYHAKVDYHGEAKHPSDYKHQQLYH